MENTNDSKTGNAAGKHHKPGKDTSEKNYIPNPDHVNNRKQLKRSKADGELRDLVAALFFYKEAGEINKQLIEMLGMSMAHESLNEFPEKRDDLCLTIQKLQQFMLRIEPFAAK